LNLVTQNEEEIKKMYGNNCIFMAIKENFDFDIQETFENSKRKKTESTLKI